MPQFEEFMKATFHNGKDVVPNFSTQPTWMYNTADWSYPTDPNDVDWNYPRGGPNPNTTQLYGPSTFEKRLTSRIAEYYGRLLSWMMKGGFTDELGVFHTSGRHYPLTHWEVYNEPEVTYLNTESCLWYLGLSWPRCKTIHDPVRCNR